MAGNQLKKINNRQKIALTKQDLVIHKNYKDKTKI